MGYFANLMEVAMSIKHTPMQGGQGHMNQIPGTLQWDRAHARCPTPHAHGILTL